ncbi:MAG: hypothetical protein R3E31_31155 [Chloroflexota bacterium]
MKQARAAILISSILVTAITWSFAAILSVSAQTDITSDRTTPEAITHTVTVTDSQPIALPLSSSQVLTIFLASPQAAPVMAAPVMAAASSDLSSGLVACWDMDEASGTRYDASGNGHDLSAYGTAGRVSGLSGYALNLDGASYLETVDTAAFQFGSSSFTIITFASVNYNNTIMSLGSTAGQYAWRMLRTSTQNFFGYVSANGSTTVNTTAGLTTQDVSLYALRRNGMTINAIYNSAWSANLQFLDPLFSSSEPLQIGKYGTAYASGRLDTTAVWNRALAVDDLTWLYNDGNARSCADILAETGPTPTPIPTATPLPTATATATPAPTITPTPLPTATPMPIIASSLYTTTLPSGGTAVLDMRATAGEIGVIITVSIIALFSLYNWLERLVRALSPHQPGDNK